MEMSTVHGRRVREPCRQLLPVGQAGYGQTRCSEGYRLGSVALSPSVSIATSAHLIEEIFGERMVKRHVGMLIVDKSLSISGSATRAYFGPLSVMATRTPTVRHGRVRGRGPGQREDGEEKPGQRNQAHFARGGQLYSLTQLKCTVRYGMVLLCTENKYHQLST